MQVFASFTGFILLFVLVLLIQPTIIYYLWDDTFVKFFGVQDVTFMDSVWISIISSVLFKSSTTNSSK